MQGRAPSGAYPGDHQMCDRTLVSIQLHRIDIKDGGPARVPTLAVHVPASLRKDDVLVQAT